MKSTLIIVALLLMLGGCKSTGAPTLYQQLDGKAGIERLIDSFINQIARDEKIIHYFEDANITHFRDGFINHLCALTDGPCEYIGDDMVAIHTGMNINETDFNHVVELLINAMNELNINHTVQNKVLAKMAPLRAEIIEI
ncbi:group 1 truncated hemoglobin [Pseudoalteromonas sp. NEC-BIFX-2020_002]|uniref:group I truncated hemoglobin n=1 Tax=Pseudoalteromonas sp. NEC-BIFX-2020_002 TaxID=2732353 RepID=UPI001477568F|nr:group 1 truncated hemoglobin [Pseudoalteromonas sp. NEC-BIFX-2020_002]NNG44514.1 group 1 truncated hemoglobin [Pseudoalteromonas sp. NEC-BIFX-2020_002]